VKRLPNAPGVYRMMNAAGDVLYVGKARSLKKRVTNYAQGRFHTSRIGRMVRETSTMEFVVTRTEIEALLLEANLIKRLRPRFNVLMRDDKSFPYILLTGDHVSPGIYKHRGARSRKGDYFGPFASAGAVGRTINSLQRAFLLRSCTNSFYENRTRPCLLFQIKRCAGPCTGEISHGDYARLVAEAKDFLSGRSQKVKTDISAAMQQASENLDFERAAIYRDRLAALSHVQSHQGINPQTVDEADVFAIHQEGGQVCIQVFGNNAAVTFAGSQGHFELNVYNPLMAYNFLQSVQLLADASISFTDNCVVGIEAREDNIKAALDRSLMLVTALAPTIGYDNAAKIAKTAHKNGTTLREEALATGLVTEADYDRLVRPEDMTHPG
ncbi:MAG: hypothetical protein E5W40_10090, partial [Mesorhizobium sp.]